LQTNLLDDCGTLPRSLPLSPDQLRLTKRIYCGYDFPADGTLQEQQDHVRELQTRVPAVVDTFNRVVDVEVECLAANIDENDHTVFACPDLQFELELLEQAIAKKILFLENQVYSSPSLTDGV
jgi:hypothetical protein